MESVPRAALTVGDEIGTGRFKRVHRGLYKRKDVVILRYSKDGDGNELRILTWLGQKGPNHLVPEMFGICNERDATSVVQELAPWGALKAVLKDDELGPRVAAAHRLRGGAQIARAMAFLQSARVVHADLSCRNVLVCRLEVDPASFHLKVTDFGLSVLLQEDADCENKKQPQATRWCSPETIAFQKLSHRADAWSYGVTIWEMFSDGALPWPRREKRSNVAARLRDIAENAGLAEGGTDVSEDFALPLGCPQPAHELLLQCFAVDEFSRPTFVQLQESFDRVIQAVERTADEAEEGDVAPNGETKAPPHTLTPSTAEPSGLPSSGYETPPGADADGTAGTSSKVLNFMALKALLRSPQTAEYVAEDSMQAMWKEIEEAQARELYLLDLVRRMQAFMSRADAPGSPERREDHSSPCMSVRFPTRASAPCLVPASFLAPRAASAPRPPVRAPHSPTLSYVPSTEHLVKPSGTLPQTAPGRWSLWSFSGPQLRRQDFVTEAEAWAAFDIEAKVSPCILRDPSGAEAAARNWVASYFRHPSPSANVAAVSHPGVATEPLAAPGLVPHSAAAAVAAAASCAAEPLASPARGPLAWRAGLIETIGVPLRTSLRSEHRSVSPLRSPSCPLRVPQEPVFDAAFVSALSARGPVDGRPHMDLSTAS